MGQVINTKPNMVGIKDTKPNAINVIGKTEVYLETRTINIGNPMGLLLTLTYPNSFTFTANRL